MGQEGLFPAQNGGIGIGASQKQRATIGFGDQAVSLRCMATHRSGTNERSIDQMKKAARANRNLGLTASVIFTGSLAFPYLSPWPQRLEGLIDEVFTELARR